MAKAVFEPAVTQVEVVQLSPATVTIVLSLEEAGRLRALLGQCSWRPETGVSQGLYDELHGMDLPWFKVKRQNGDAIPAMFVTPTDGDPYAAE
jgi:hypothetical protein